MLKSVLNVVDQVAQGQVAQITDTAAPPVQIVTPAIQMTLQLDDPTVPDPSSNGTLPRIYSASITAPGSSSSFDPLPVGALSAANGTVRTTFVSLAFDPHSDPVEAALTGRSGITRLAFSSGADGSPVPVQNLSTPITFSLPAVDLSAINITALLGDNSTNATGSAAPASRRLLMLAAKARLREDTSRQGQCVFYDEVLEQYSSDGCVALPNPLPPWVTAYFIPGFVANSTLDLARSWRLNETMPAPFGVGPLPTPTLSNCNEIFLDCFNATDRNRTIYPDPRRPLDYPAVSCGPNASSRVLRIFQGPLCPAFRFDQRDCYWNATLQAFSGSGCVTASATKCACQARHRPLSPIRTPCPPSTTISGQCS